MGTKFLVFLLFVIFSIAFGDDPPGPDPIDPIPDPNHPQEGLPWFFETRIRVNLLEFKKTVDLEVYFDGQEVTDGGTFTRRGRASFTAREDGMTRTEVWDFETQTVKKIDGHMCTVSGIGDANTTFYLPLFPHQELENSNERQLLHPRYLLLLDDNMKYIGQDRIADMSVHHWQVVVDEFDGMGIPTKKKCTIDHFYSDPNEMQPFCEMLPCKSVPVQVRIACDEDEASTELKKPHHLLDFVYFRPMVSDLGNLEVPKGSFCTGVPELKPIPKLPPLVQFQQEVSVVGSPNQKINKQFYIDFRDDANTNVMKEVETTQISGKLTTRAYIRDFGTGTLHTIAEGDQKCFETFLAEGVPNADQYLWGFDLHVYQDQFIGQRICGKFLCEVWSVLEKGKNLSDIHDMKGTNFYDLYFVNDGSNPDVKKKFPFRMDTFQLFEERGMLWSKQIQSTAIYGYETALVDWNNFDPKECTAYMDKIGVRIVFDGAFDHLGNFKPMLKEEFRKKIFEVAKFEHPTRINNINLGHTGDDKKKGYGSFMIYGGPLANDVTLISNEKAIENLKSTINDGGFSFNYKQDGLEVDLTFKASKMYVMNATKMYEFVENDKNNTDSIFFREIETKSAPDDSSNTGLVVGLLFVGVLIGFLVFFVALAVGARRNPRVLLFFRQQ